VFQRRVLERHLNAKKPISLVMAVPDHPWTKVTKDAAAVRIAMTVAAAGKKEGMLREVVSESATDTDAPVIEFAEKIGEINVDLTVGLDVTKAARATPRPPAGELPEAALNTSPAPRFADEVWELETKS
jgi:hypothetical protein